jgi:prophage antirepressor-like protein
MENKLEIFKNEQFGEVRTVLIDGEPWFVLTDICRALELTTVSRVAERLEKDEVSQTHIIDSLGRNQETTIVSETWIIQRNNS